MIEFPASAVSTWGGVIVFINVLLTRLGVPIPAVPVLLFAGSAIAAHTLGFWPVLCAAVVAALIGDGTWFADGRIYGRRLLGALGRLLPALDSKVEKARALFERFGVPLVSISKFVPGLALITPPLMGTTAVDVRIYALWDFAGAAAWASFWLLGGAAAEAQLHMLLMFVRARGGTVLDVLAAAALIYLAYRLQQRRRDRRRFAQLAAEHVNIDIDVEADSSTSPREWRQGARAKVLDARPHASLHHDSPADAQARTPDEPRRIPGALPLDAGSPEQIDFALRVYDVVIYCICPDSATALDITQHMRNQGYTRIRALRGGLDAWQRRGFPAEPPRGVADEVIAGRHKLKWAGDVSGVVTLRGFAPRRDMRDSRDTRDKRN